MAPAERDGSSGPIATLTVWPRSGAPSTEAIEAGLQQLFPSDRYRIRHRAMAIDGETQIVFDVYAL